MSKLIATYNGVPVDQSRGKDWAINSDYVIPKMLPQHFGTYEYTFSTNPTNQTYEMFTVDFSELDYMPMGFMTIEQTTDYPDQFALLVNYTIFSCFDFEPLPPFDSTSTSQSMTGYLDRSRKEYVVEYYHEHNTDPGYGGTPCSQLNVNGKTYTFKYYIWVEGDEDEDLETITETI